MALKLITFDVTGTLLVLRESVGQVYSRVGAKHGITVSPNALTTSFSIMFKKLLIDYPNFGESAIGWQEWWKKLVIGTFEESSNSKCQNQTINYEKYYKISSELIEIYTTDECWKLTNGARDLLDKLTQKNLYLGVISNYDPRLEGILEALKIRQYFKFVVTSYNAQCSKPDPAIFLIVKDLFKSIDERQMLHIGDNVKLDYYGAKNVGWNAILIAKDMNRLKESHPDIDTNWVVKDINNLHSLLLARRMVTATENK